MKVDAFVGKYSTLYHMAEEPNWPGILERGLLSTSALLDLYGYTGDARAGIESRFRKEKVTISKAGFAPVVIRDQKPLDPVELAPLLLQGMATEEWYRLINGKVFFWAEWYRLDWLLGARAYRGYPHVVIKVDPRFLLDRCGARTTLTSINSGSALRSASGSRAPSRGPSTFQTIEAFDASRSVVEVAVDVRVDDVRAVARSAELWIKKSRDEPATMLRTLWAGPTADASQATTIPGGSMA
jgi:hypothetical protein